MLASFRATSLRLESGKFRKASSFPRFAPREESRIVLIESNVVRFCRSFPLSVSGRPRRPRARTRDALVSPCQRVCGSRRCIASTALIRTRCTYRVRNVGTRGFPGGIYSRISTSRDWDSRRALFAEARSLWHSRGTRGTPLVGSARCGAYLSAVRLTPPRDSSHA